MNKSVADIVDLVILVILIAAGFSLGAKGLYSVRKELDSYSLSVEDKNVAEKVTDTKQYGDYNSLLSVGEMIISTQIQDDGLDKGSVFTLENIRLEIDTVKSDTDTMQEYYKAAKNALSTQYTYLMRWDYASQTYKATAYIDCPDCGREYDAHETACDRCGAINPRRIIGGQ